MTGRGRYGIEVGVAYDFVDFGWAQDIDPDQPRHIMYKVA